METRKIKFLEHYKNSSTLKEAIKEMHTSYEQIKKWKDEDSEFRCEYEKIRQERNNSRVSQDDYKQRIDNFFAFLKHTNVTDALKKAHLGTHKFMELKRNDKDFIERYNRIKAGCSKFERRLLEEKQECICCGRTKPLADFVYKKGLQRYILKTCNDCKKRKNEDSDKKKGDTKGYLREKLREIENDMQKYANSLDFENYIATRREYDFYKRKLDGVKNYE